MVKQGPAIYLFLGQDPLSKDIKLKSIKQEILKSNLEQFNLDVLYARELSLGDLQERMLFLPLGAQKRIVVIKNAQALKKDLQEFILQYAKKPQQRTVLILDAGRYDLRDQFLNRIMKVSQVVRFQDNIQPDTFALARQVNLKKADYALRTLNQLLNNGDKPEWILGGLRYATERDIVHPLEKRKRLKLLLSCDIDIKTGRLKPAFALEKLIVSLCGFS